MQLIIKRYASVSFLAKKFGIVNNHQILIDKLEEIVIKGMALDLPLI